MEDELIEQGNPFGNVVNTKCNVGPSNRDYTIPYCEYWFDMSQRLYLPVAQSAIEGGGQVMLGLFCFKG
jgi:hypothetical protein